MKKTRSAVILVQTMLILALLSARMRADSGTCGGVTSTVPFTDVASSIFFCQIAEAYFSGLTNGTSATTYSPSQNVPREQMAAFITRTLDQSLKRGSRRAALKQFWTTQGDGVEALTTVGTTPSLVESDGADVWVANNFSNTVSRVRASDGRLLETWTGATAATGVLIAMGRVFVTGSTNPGSLYMIDPSQAAGAVTVVSNGLGAFPMGIAFDGGRIWTANHGAVSIVTPGTTLPWSVTTVARNFFGVLMGIVFDGSNIWVTDLLAASLYKLDQNGAIVQNVIVGLLPRFPAFDGTNIWVPNESDGTVSVVRAATGAVIATLSCPPIRPPGGNGPFQAAFDGQRILVTNFFDHGVMLWKASDLTPLTPLSPIPLGGSTLSEPFGACSDGISFWVTLSGTNQLARF